MAAREALLELVDISKSYGAFKANDRISLKIRAGEIHALLGENGAGKSTLVKMLYGSLKPDEGRILWRGNKVGIASPADARALGIGMVFQHFSLFDALTVAENVALAMAPGKPVSAVGDELANISSSYGLPLNAHARIHDLSVGERQRVEIVRCLLQHPELIMMDEPTSVLTPQEAQDLFGVLRRLQSEGKAVLYISHKLAEVQALCQQATVLRHGAVVAECVPTTETPASLARMMVGTDIHAVLPRDQPAANGEVLFQVKDLDLDGENAFETDLKEIGFELRRGEISGVAGIAGNGQNELFSALSGERPVPDGQILIKGQPAGHLGILSRRKLGVVYISEERLGHGTVPAFSLSENVILTRHGLEKKLHSGPFLSRMTARRIKDTITNALDIRKGSVDPAAQSLSGGNLQKFVLGREVIGDVDILIINQPTWGVDAGSAANIRQILVDLSRKGASVLVISQDLDELFEITDRIATLNAGRLSQFVPVDATDREMIGLQMTS